VRSTRLLMSTLAVAGTIAGCAATSHLAAVQPPRPRVTPSVVSQPAVATVAWARKPGRQLGIDVDYYVYSPAQDVSGIASAEVAYVKSVHANALSVSFPFFTNGWSGSTVYGNGETPTPADLAIFARAAKRAGLYFSIRPLMDESSLHHNGARVSRTKWVPAHPAAWFASYQRFLRPYARMAEQQRIPEFFTGAEFDKFGSSPYWAKLDSYLRRYYHGALAYANNWEIAIPRAVDRHQVAQTADAYPPMSAASSASVATLTGKWGRYLKGKGRGVVISEIGIAAQAGAYAKPFRLRWTGEPLDAAIQVRWFTAACNAMVNVHGGGIYFWSLNFGQQLNSPPTAADPTAFVDGPGAGAISACFKRLR
jgi:hypothetical protein